jgi:hypothetical protein
MDKQLSTQDRDEVMWKAQNGLALSLKELSVASGYGYSHWRAWKAQGLPLIAGKIPLKKAVEWVEQWAQVGQSQVRCQSHPRPSAVSRFGALV